MSSTHRYRSFIWPALFILAGILALLVNTGTISVDRLYQLLDLWPLILIVIGLEIIVNRALKGRTGELAAALIVVLAIGGAVAYIALAPNPAFGTGQSVDASASRGNLDHASVEIDAGAATVTVSGGESLDGDLYRAHIEYSGPKPDISFDASGGALRISENNPGFNVFRIHTFVVDLQLDPGVTWAISTNSGAATDTFKLGALQISSIEINTGASREDITLGLPSGVVPVSVNGGALTVHVHRPNGVAASVAVSGGAVSLEADGKVTHTIGNASYESPGSIGATDAYRIDVSGGACTVTLDQNAASG